MRYAIEILNKELRDLEVLSSSMRLDIDKKSESQKFFHAQEIEKVNRKMSELKKAIRRLSE